MDEKELNKIKIIDNLEAFMSQRNLDPNGAMAAMRNTLTQLEAYMNTINESEGKIKEEIEELKRNIHLLMYIREQEQNFQLYCYFRKNVLMHGFSKEPVTHTYFCEKTGAKHEYEKNKCDQVMKKLKDERLVCEKKLQNIGKTAEVMHSKLRIARKNLYNFYKIGKALRKNTTEMDSELDAEIDRMIRTRKC